MGRFINEDPLGFAGSGPNFYAYVGDDPIDFSDPSGLARGSWWDPRSYYTDGWTTLRDIGTAAEAFTDTITFGSASRLNDALGANVAVDRCGIGHKLAAAGGFVASIPLGGEALPAALKWLPNRAKGAIGEGLSIVKNALSGSTLVGRQVKAAQLGLKGLTTVFDSVWASSSRGIYYVESKFGAASLTAAQHAAAAALGDAYQVEQWTYPFFGGIGNFLGGAAGVGGAMAGRSCGCQ